MISSRGAESTTPESVVSTRWRKDCPMSPVLLHGRIAPTTQTWSPPTVPQLGVSNSNACWTSRTSPVDGSLAMLERPPTRMMGPHAPFEQIGSPPPQGV